MAQEIRTLLWCDACMQQGVNTEATTMEPIAMGKSGYLVLDLCKEHQEELVEPLRGLLLGEGRSLPEGVTPHGHLCTDCGKTLNSAQGLKLHRSRMHNQQDNSEEFVCPECGKSDWANPGPQAVHMHRVRKHGYVGTRHQGS